MRGLTNEERAALERWSRGVYVGTSDSIVFALMRDGRADWQLCAPQTVEAYPTAAGFLALKLDALARATVPA